MFGFLKKQKKRPLADSATENKAFSEQPQSALQAEETAKKNFFDRLKQNLSHTRRQFSEGIATLFLGKKTIDHVLFEELETVLLKGDVGVATTKRLMEAMTAEVRRKQLKDPAHLFLTLQQQLTGLLVPYTKPMVIPPLVKPFVILMVGVNGVGKTTTIAKLAHKFKEEHKKVLLAAGDTFRAAAVEQLQVWGERNQFPVIAQKGNADSASVIYDAFMSACAKGIDVLIADTAGRLHTKGNLMEELKKIKRVLSKLDGEAPHETLLVLDAGNGQNAVVQAKEFHQAIGVSGIILTKLDGTAKGGVIFSIAEQLKLPIRFIGIGEQKEDLRPFNAEEFIAALFGEK